MLAKLVSDDSTGMGDEGFDDIFLQSKGQIQIRPCLVAVFNHGEAEDKVVYIFDVPFSLAFVAEAQHHTRYFDIRECHVFRCSRHHCCEIIRRLLLLGFVTISMDTESFGFRITID